MKPILTSCLFILLYSCSSQKITTVWKADPVFPNRYHRILVVAILPEQDTLLRARIEKETANSLNKMGYDAISAISAFGPKGLAEPGEEATYLKLCTIGTDAVMTLAVVPREKESHYP